MKFFETSIYGNRRPELNRCTGEYIKEIGQFSDRLARILTPKNSCRWPFTRRNLHLFVNEIINGTAGVYEGEV